MADDDVPPPPPGFLPGPPPPPPPEGLVPGAPPQQPYTGGMVPWSIDASGKRSFDPHAGVLGSAIDAFTLPHDILTGQQPTPYTGGGAEVDPALLQRTLNLATQISPTSAASRTGMLPAGTLSGPPPTSYVPSPTRTGPLVPGGFASLAVPTSEELSQAGLPQRGPGGQFLPGTPAFTADPRNLAAAQRSDAVTALANPPLTGPTLPIRQQVASFIADPNNLKGFTTDEISALNKFAQGSSIPAKIGSAIEGKLGSALASGAGALLGFKHGETGGGALGALVAPMISEPLKPLIGWPFKAWANAQASSQLDALGQMLRSRSPLGEQYLNQNVRAPNTLLNQRIPSLLTPYAPQQQPQPVPRFPPLPTTGPIPQGLLGPWA